MKRKKLLRQMKDLLSANKRAQVAKYDSLEKVLTNLKAKESKLRERLDGEDDKKKRRDILRKLEVLEAQRKKGVALKKEIEERRDSD